MSLKYILLLILVFVGCSTTGNLESKNTPSNSISDAAKTAQPTLAAPPAIITKVKPSQTSNLRIKLSEFLQNHPNTTFETTVLLANKMLQKYGLITNIGVSQAINTNKSSIVIRSGKNEFSFQSGSELTEAPDICGERYLQIPTLPIDHRNSFLILDQKKYKFSLRSFTLEAFRIFKGHKPIKELLAPEPTEPIGVNEAGNALYFKFLLDEELTSEWWKTITANQPEISLNTPYLVLRIQNHGWKFEANIERLLPQQFEAIDDGSGELTWRFIPSSYKVQLSSRCGP